jgi:hypothetical protein
MAEFGSTVHQYLREHARRETLRRMSCPTCQFEYTIEDDHLCRVNPGAPSDPTGEKDHHAGVDLQES